ncbi:MULTISPECIES: GOLPH3/VPS74 family protein [unclassified Isoptericola]|uniref:GOLPH3/VPS74 family protein n=1 Tax=unclassified Isoptericola TaxID=2623355 RepID=UPI00364B5FD3
MIIAEDLLLLAYDDASGRPRLDRLQLDYRLAGALLVELALDGRVEVTTTAGADAAGRRVGAGRVTVLDASPTGHPALDHALAFAQTRPRTPKSLVAPLAKGLRTQLLTGLAERGVLRREDETVFWVFPTTSWPAADATHETQLRATCRDVLLGGRDPDARTAALLAMANGSPLVRGLVPPQDRRRAEARAKELASRSWASAAVKKAVDEVQAAVMVAVMIPAMTATTT